MKLFKFIIIANLLLLGQRALAQDSSADAQTLDDQEVISVENLYKNNPPPVVRPIQQPQSQLPVSREEQQQQTEIKNNVEVQNSKVKSLNDLNKLAPFSDISVIQKKYLPKTERFQLYVAGGLTTNSPWFLNLGAKVNFAYHFSESFGVELSGMFLSNSALDSAKDLKQNNNLQPDKFVVTKNNLGVDLVWSPIYGKITNLNNEIIPFDMYFAGGAGTSSTTAQEGSVPTFHLATGQIFALSKSFAFRWDYSWNFYQATPVADATSTTAPSKSTYNDLIFTAGVSFFFPEVSSR
jgi:outer membrane beta-barrel protein